MSQASPKQYTSDVAVINVPSKVGRENWERCWKAAAAQPGGVFGINETFLEDCKKLYLRLTRQHNFGVAGTRSPNWMFYDRTIWRRKKSKVIKLHSAGTLPIQKKYDGYNSARFATVLTLTHRKSGREETFILVHLVVPPGKFVPREWQRSVKHQSVVKLRELVLSEIRAGRPCWVMGDTNTEGSLNLGVGRFKWIKGDGIDKIGLALPDYLVRGKSNASYFKAPTDHRWGGVRARASWSRK